MRSDPTKPLCVCANPQKCTCLASSPPAETGRCPRCLHAYHDGRNGHFGCGKLLIGGAICACPDSEPYHPNRTPAAEPAETKAEPLCGQCGSPMRDGRCSVQPWHFLSPEPAAPVSLPQCPKCGKPVKSSHHGDYCPDPTCKWGWDVEMDGSPLQPPEPPQRERQESCPKCDGNGCAMCEVAPVSPACNHVNLKRQNVGEQHWYRCECGQKFKVVPWDGKVTVLGKAAPVSPPLGTCETGNHDRYWGEHSQKPTCINWHEVGTVGAKPESPKESVVELARRAWNSWQIPGVMQWISRLTLEECESADTAIIQFWAGFAESYSASLHSPAQPVRTQCDYALIAKKLSAQLKSMGADVHPSKLEMWLERELAQPVGSVNKE